MTNFSKLAVAVNFTASSKEPVRVFKRADVEGEVLFNSDTEFFIATLRNISAGGFFVECSVTIPAGQCVRVVIKSSKLEQPVQAIGTIVRVETKDRPGLAVEFTSISSRAREIIQNCVFEARMQSSLKVA
jgi:c-di-GMP-binding flagellar brake protein YcgR